MEIKWIMEHYSAPIYAMLLIAAGALLWKYPRERSRVFFILYSGLGALLMLYGIFALWMSHLAFNS
jgi:hypothetical protein